MVTPTPSLPSTVNATLTDTHYYFYGEPSTFSNWYESLSQFRDPLEGNLSFNSSEQAFMWRKAIFFQDTKIATALEQVTSPSHCKVLGKQIQGYDDAAWSCVRLGVMQYVLLLKYRQNPELRAELLATGNRTLVEASPYDGVWGVKLRHDDPMILDSRFWRGQNLLGEALMTVRRLLTATKTA